MGPPPWRVRLWTYRSHNTASADRKRSLSRGQGPSGGRTNGRIARTRAGGTSGRIARARAGGTSGRAARTRVGGASGRAACTRAGGHAPARWPRSRRRNAVARRAGEHGPCVTAGGPRRGAATAAAVAVQRWTGSTAWLVQPQTLVAIGRLRPPAGGGRLHRGRPAPSMHAVGVPDPIPPDRAVAVQRALLLSWGLPRPLGARRARHTGIKGQPERGDGRGEGTTHPHQLASTQPLSPPGLPPHYPHRLDPPTSPGRRASSHLRRPLGRRCRSWPPPATGVAAGSVATAMPRAPKPAAAAAPADPARRRAAPPVLVDRRRGRRQGAGSGGRPAAAAAPVAAATRPPRGRAAAAATPARAGGGGGDARGEGTAAGSLWADSTNTRTLESVRTYSQAQPGAVFKIEFSLGCLCCSKRAGHFEWFFGVIEGKYTVFHVSTFVGTCLLRFEAGATLPSCSGVFREGPGPVPPCRAAADCTCVEN